MQNLEREGVDRLGWLIARALNVEMLTRVLAQQRLRDLAVR